MGFYQTEVFFEEILAAEEAVLECKQKVRQSERALVEAQAWLGMRKQYLTEAEHKLKLLKDKNI